LRKLATNILDGAGYKVLQASNGIEALDIFTANAEHIDLMLIDMIMPKMNGKGVYDALHQQHPNLHFLFSSGYTTSSIHSDFVREKGIEMIQKPYTPNALLRKIREVLATAPALK
jgi:CheY-like chemotaxis protein